MTSHGCVELLNLVCEKTLRSAIMAYNREWDHGKDAWHDSGAWSDASGKVNVHPRNEEPYGEGKRRKYNNGVSQPPNFNPYISFSGFLGA